MWNRFLILCFLMIVHSCIYAQDVNITSGKAAYISFNDGKRLAKDSIWDEPLNWPASEHKIGLGFNLQFFGVEWDTVYVDQGMIIIPGDTSEVWIGLYHDLCDRGMGGRRPVSPVSFKTDGSAPNRIVKIQWRNFGFYDDYIINSRCNDSGNLQIWIYEGQNKTEMRFGKSYLANRTVTLPDGVGVVCGEVGDFGGQKGFSLTGSPDFPSKGDFETGFMNAWPKDSTVYTFTSSSATNNIRFIQKQSTAWVYGQDIYTPGKSLKKITLYNAAGQTVWALNTAERKNRLPELKAGIYRAVIQYPGKQELLSFIISD